MQYIILLIIFALNIASGIFYTKIINTPICSNKYLNYHHIVLLQKNKPFAKNQTIYNNIYAIDFCPYENIFKILLGRPIEGNIRLFYIDSCKVSDVYKVIKKSNINNKLIYEIKNIDINIYNKIKLWQLNFNIYSRNCRHFASYIIN